MLFHIVQSQTHHTLDTRWTKNQKNVCCIIGLMNACELKIDDELTLLPSNTLTILEPVSNLIVKTNSSPIVVAGIEKNEIEGLPTNCKLTISHLETEILVEHFLNKPENDKSRECALKLVLTTIKEELRLRFNEKTKQPMTPAQRIENYLLANLENNLSLNELQDFFQCSVSHLIRTLEQEGKPPPMQLFAQLKTRHAKDLLRGTELTISQIGAELGMSSLSAFSHFFQRQTGQSPSQYRKNVKWLL